MIKSEAVQEEYMGTSPIAKISHDEDVLTIEYGGFVIVRSNDNVGSYQRADRSPDFSEGRRVKSLVEFMRSQTSPGLNHDFQHGGRGSIGRLP